MLITKGQDVLARVSRYGKACATPGFDDATAADAWTEVETAVTDLFGHARQIGRDQVLDDLRTIASSRSRCDGLREASGVRAHIPHGTLRSLLRGLIEELSTKGDAGGRAMASEPGS